jgi:hypothetical protein
VERARAILARVKTYAETTKTSVPATMLMHFYKDLYSDLDSDPAATLASHLGDASALPH